MNVADDFFNRPKHRVPYPARGYMFIARRNPYLRRRSEEREAASVLRASSFPAPPNGVGVALEWSGYKHATPNGVKKPGYLVITNRSAEMIAEKQNSDLELFAIEICVISVICG